MRKLSTGNWQLATIGVLCASAVIGSLAAEEEALPQPDPDQAKFDAAMREVHQKSAQERAEGFAADNKKIAEQKAADDAKIAQPGTATVTLDEETRTVTEPATQEDALGFAADRKVRDEYEISPEDFDLYKHDRWSLNLSDFKFDAPEYITRETILGAEKTWWGFTFSITNSTSQKRRIAPLFAAVTNKGVMNYAVGGFQPERLLADSTFRPLGLSANLHDRDLAQQGRTPLESNLSLATDALDPLNKTETFSAQTFEPGQTRWGAALWSKFSDDFTELKVVVQGLTNAHKFDEKLRRVLVLTFTRAGDEHDALRTELKFVDKQWAYVWMWDQDITVPIPATATEPQIKVQKVGEKTVWAFPFIVHNSTPTNQDFAINKVSFALPVEVTVGGEKVALEAKIVDDGFSTIYKKQALMAWNKDDPKDRFEAKNMPFGSKTTAERRLTTLEHGKALDENLAVFDETDVNWSDAVAQVEDALTQRIDKKALAQQTWDKLVDQYGGGKKDLAAKNPGMLYDPRRRLNDDEIAALKEQVVKALPAALDAAKAKKTVVAYFDCTAGLSSGEYRVSRCYRQPGVVDESWLKAWEELEKYTPAADAAQAPAAAPAAN